MSSDSKLELTLDRMMVILDTLNTKLININEEYNTQQKDIDAITLILKDHDDNLNDFILNQKVVMTELRERITEDKKHQDETVAELKKQIEELRTLTVKKEEIRECQSKCCKRKNKCCVVM
jgi:hypothetical protein